MHLHDALETRTNRTFKVADRRFAWSSDKRDASVEHGVEMVVVGAVVVSSGVDVSVTGAAAKINTNRIIT